MPLKTSIATIGAERTRELAPEIGRVYKAAFGVPPNSATDEEVALFLDRGLPRHSYRAGFRCCVATLPGGELVGFAYGYTGEFGQYWTDKVAGGLDDATVEAWMPGHFEFVELAVSPEYQGRGVGGNLHDALLEGLPHSRAMLSTVEADTPARRMYLRRGWVELLRGFRFSPDGPPFVIMGLDLAQRS